MIILAAVTVSEHRALLVVLDAPGAAWPVVVERDARPHVESWVARIVEPRELPGFGDEAAGALVRRARLAFVERFGGEPNPGIARVLGVVETAAIRAAAVDFVAKGRAAA